MLKPRANCCSDIMKVSDTGFTTHINGDDVFSFNTLKLPLLFNQFVILHWVISLKKLMTLIKSGEA